MYSFLIVLFIPTLITILITFAPTFGTPDVGVFLYPVARLAKKHCPSAKKVFSNFAEVNLYYCLVRFIEYKKYK